MAFEQPIFRRLGPSSGWVTEPTLSGAEIETTGQPCPICQHHHPPAQICLLHVRAHPGPGQRTDPFCLVHGYPDEFHPTLLGMVLRLHMRRRHPQLRDWFALVVADIDADLSLHRVDYARPDGQLDFTGHGQGYVTTRHPAFWRPARDPNVVPFSIHDPAPQSLRHAETRQPWRMDLANLTGS